MQKVIELARGSGATIHLVCAYRGKSALERIGMTARQEPVDLRGVAADLLARDERRLDEAGIEVEKYVREGDPAHTILDVADEKDADLIVLGAHGNTGLRRLHARQRREQARASCADEPADRARELSGVSGHRLNTVREPSD